MFSYPELNCQNCDGKLKEERGHSENGIIPFWVNEEMQFRCPLTFVTSLTWEYMRAFSLYEKGFLPNGSGWANESNKFNRAIFILGNSFNESRNREIKSVRR